MKSYYILLPALLLLGSCSTGKVQEENISETSVRVRTLTLDSSYIGSPHRNYVGTIEAQTTVSLSFSNGGLIISLPLSEGQKARKGQLLGKLDPQTAQSSYNAARSTLEQAEDGYKRAKKVYEQGSLPEVKWIEIQSKVEQARAMEQIAKKTLNDCNIYAPFNGMVGSYLLEEGSNALPMQPVMTFLNIDTVIVKFSVPENEISSVQLGDELSIVVAALDYKHFNCHITEKGVTANTLSHSYIVKATLANKDYSLLPGMVSKVLYGPSSEEHTLNIPANIIQTGSEGYYVWVNDNGTAKRQDVEVGNYVGDNVIIKEGLHIGQQIIIEGYLKLSDGCKIEAVS